MFKVGEYIIYKRDLCKIQAIEKNPLTKEDYYKLSPMTDETLSIKVPANNKFHNLRYPISKKEAEDLIQKIPEISPLKTNDKLLESEYRNLMKTNQHEDLIKIIKTTYLRSEDRKNQGKKVSEKDQLFFKQAETYLYTELAYSLKMSFEECKKHIILEVENSLRKEES
ncbi:MAG: CarD family transcriptional regulator [Erysipelotrichaceae bacterium]|nr:CarD family transcriptional regulator [Erysipelotrichaceae bacterium]